MSILGTDITPLKFALMMLGSALGWLVAWGIRAWWRDWSSRLCRGGHRKRYVELTRWTNWNCGQHFKIHSEDDEWWATSARWICTEPKCSAYGWDCLGHKKIFWKIEHGAVVPDKKLMESPPTDVLSPKEHMNWQRAQKTVSKDLTFDDVFKATEQAMLKNVKAMAEELESRREQGEKGKSDAPKS